MSKHGVNNNSNPGSVSVDCFLDDPEICSLELDELHPTVSWWTHIANPDDTSDDCPLKDPGAMNLLDWQVCPTEVARPTLRLQ